MFAAADFPAAHCVVMAVDRTAEFQAAVSSIASRSSKTPAESRRLLSSSYPNGELSRPTPKSEFSRMAAKIGHDINSTGAKLQKLAQRILPFQKKPPNHPFLVICLALALAQCF